MSKRPIQPRLIILSAPSGAGKSTLCRLLLDSYPNIVGSVSATTRSPRSDEKEGVHYFFLDETEFNRRIAAGEFVEWARVHEHLYGTPRNYVEECLAAGRHVLFDIDVQGAMNLKKQYPQRVLLIFVLPPSVEELRRRLRERKTEDIRSIETRMHNAYNELAWKEKFQYQLINDDLEIAFQNLRRIIEKECQL